MVEHTRRGLIRGAAAVLAGTALSAADVFTTRRPEFVQSAPATGWVQFRQPELGVALRYPQGWTFRVFENGVAGVAERADGLAGARAYGQIFFLAPGATSQILAGLFSQFVTQSFDGFRVAQTIRLSTLPDVSAVRYTVPYLDGPRKGTMMIGVASNVGLLLGYDAPRQVYASRVDTLTEIVASFQWSMPSLNLRPVYEPREGAFGMLVPAGWRANLGVIRPQIDAGYVATAVDPSGLLSLEIHRPQTPGFITPSPLLRQGTWYDLGNKWGMQPLLVYPYLPGKEYVRSFLLPLLQRTRPGARLTAWGDRPDLTLTPDMATNRRFGGEPAGGEVEYTWTGPAGRRMRGRAVVVTGKIPLAPGGAALWGAPFLVVAEAPEPQFGTAVSAMIAMNASLHINVTWYATEVKTAAQRWRIIMDTETRLFQEYQEVQLRRALAVEVGMNNWDAYIKWGSESWNPSFIIPGGLSGADRDKFIKDHGGKLKEDW